MTYWFCAFANLGAVAVGGRELPPILAHACVIMGTFCILEFALEPAKESDSAR